ncbi:hypothetical protein [Clostridium sp. CF012]|uniref:hypothetical protein n=1 Tax=Clostridium sp. CF012 TaxID=2843319 RepID=UPI001C0E0511|nr:hypothetical protein [Clostridium sp. CF012]MBU3146591.1 hypothetical protein [Clostridium sp. CF012]
MKIIGAVILLEFFDSSTVNSNEDTKGLKQIYLVIINIKLIVTKNNALVVQKMIISLLNYVVIMVVIILRIMMLIK